MKCKVANTTRCEGFEAGVAVVLFIFQCHFFLLSFYNVYIRIFGPEYKITYSYIQNLDYTIGNRQTFEQSVSNRVSQRGWIIRGDS